MKIGLAVIGGLLLAGCAGQPSSSGGPAGGTSWRMEGTRLIGCCCVAPCSCRINKPPTQAHGCEYTTVVHIDRGHIGGVKMDGAVWAQVGLGFAEKTDVNWVVVYVSEAMSEEQRKALQGWMEEGMKLINEKKLKYLAGKFVGIKVVPIRWSHSGDEYATAIPGVLDFRIKTLRNPGHPEPVTSTGVLDDFGNSFIHAETIAHSYKDASLAGYDGWDLSGRQANHADFVIGSDEPKKYTIGWGCWSGHKDFQNPTDYQERMLNHPKK